MVMCFCHRVLFASCFFVVFALCLTCSSLSLSVFIFCTCLAVSISPSSHVPLLVLHPYLVSIVRLLHLYITISFKTFFRHLYFFSFRCSVEDKFLLICALLKLKYAFYHYVCTLLSFLFLCILPYSSSCTLSSFFIS